MPPTGTPRWLTAAAAALLAAPLAAPATLRAQAAPPVTLDPALLAHYEWRNLGPDKGGRSIAAAGVPGQPDVAYFGAVGGGLWKTADGGESWQPITDGQITSASVGAVAVSPFDPDILFIGTGETCIRGNIMPGDGVYRSRDGGETWRKVGFDGVDAISKIRFHPTNPDVVFAAVFGQYSVPSQERGLYRSTDGGNTWDRVLFRDENSGAIDLSIDPNDPQVMYAALWEAFRKEYTMSSGGPGSGLYKSTDGGTTWTEITRAPGLPAEGVVGRIGVAVSPVDGQRVYALVEHENGGLFVSDDAGATFRLANDDRSIRQRSFYYTHVFADPADRDVVYVENTSLFRSEDAGQSLRSIRGTHGDFHDLWIDPQDPTHLVVANDGGGAVSTDTGGDWTDQDFPTAQFYHVVTTAHEPPHVCGAQQDNSTFCMPIGWNANRRGEDVTAGSTGAGYGAGGGEPGYIAPDPNDVDQFYSGTNNGGYVDKYNRRIGFRREVNPYPWFYSGEPSSAIRERWQWTFPILFSPADDSLLYVSSQRLWASRDGGNTWTALSGDLTRHDPATMGHSGGPITGDMNGPEVYATIFAVGPGKRTTDVIWTGSDDGLVHVTRDGGANWTNVTPPGMPDFGRVSQIDASAFDDATAYVAVKRPLLDDRAPYVFRTRDYGRTWTKIVDGLRDDDYVHVVREDPTRQGLLYAGTQHGVYVSYDDGTRWQELSLNLPDVPVVDLVVEANELVIATHGRSFWVLDNITPLRQAASGMLATDVHLFEPPVALRSGLPASFTWWLGRRPERTTLEVMDASGRVLHTMVSDTTPEVPEDQGGGFGGRGRFGGGGFIPTEEGLNTFQWNLLTEGYSTFDGMILWGARSRGPAIPPGRYTLRLTADDRTVTAPFTVARNPLIPGITDVDLVEQFRFSSMVRDRTSDANRAVIAIRRVKTQLENRLERSDDARLREAGAGLVEAASAVEADIYQVKNRSGQDPLNFPIKVNNRLANLLSMAERGDGRPNENMLEIYGILDRELAGYEARLDGVWAMELTAVNGHLRRLGLPVLDPACTEAEGCGVTP
ncbi:MAG: glycosyl hydrolase [Gemmatimonadota bacterium]